MDLHQSQHILDALNIDSLEPEDQEEILSDLADIIAVGTMTRLIEHLDEQGCVELEQLLDRDASEDEIDTFIHDHVPHSEKIVQEILDELRDDILTETRKSAHI